MPLKAGMRLGPYEIVEAIGSGGMGEVYKAVDPRLNRSVAVKVLPEHISANPESRQRFEREAQTVAGLNHPHICVLHDVGSQDGVDFIVMEFLDGTTLADRLLRGPLSMPEAVKVALDVADALDAAHRMGVVHRDLKPSNIMLTAEGAKLLDFGLAKVGDEAPPPPVTLTAAPTSLGSLTAAGSVLGTLPYMAPEQIEGQQADARTDIFALGAVLYEMLTGRRAFQGKSQPSLMAAILSTDPTAPSLLVEGLPPVMDHIVERCLQKDPADRWHSTRDLWLELKWSLDAGARLQQTGARPKTDRRAWVVSAVLLGILAAVLVPAIRYYNAAPPDSKQVRFEIPVPAMQNPNTSQIAISPDGRRIAYVAPAEGGRNMLWVRSMNAFDAQVLRGTEDALHPFWSPDSRFIAFSAGNLIKRVEIAGGAPQTLAAFGANFGGGSWSVNDVIVFSSGSAGSRRLSRIPAAGGEPVVISEPDESLNESLHVWPWFLPDGRRYIYLASNQDNTEDRAIYMGTLDSDVRTRVMESESMAVYVSGFLLYLRGRTLMARPFDPDSVQFTGDAVALAEGVAYIETAGRAQFSASDDGSLVYRREAPQTASRQFTWLDRTGRTIGTVGQPVNATTLRLSPDGRRIAYHEGPTNGPNANADLWLYDIDRDLRTRFTNYPTNDMHPVFSPDSTRIVFQGHREPDVPGQGGLFEKSSHGTTEEVFLPSETGWTLSTRDWSLDGEWFVFVKGTRQQNHFWALPMSGNRTPFQYLSTPFYAGHAAISPDSRWLAYVSDESETYQIIVQPFPNPSGGKWQVSTRGGLYPRWRRDGQELYYVDPDGRMMAVSVRSNGDAFEIVQTTPLFDTFIRFPFGVRPQGSAYPYDVSADGRFLLSIPVTQNVPIAVVVNWKP